MPTAVQNYVNAIKAYNDSVQGKPTASAPTDALQGEEFASLVKDAIKEAVKIGQKSEQLTIQGIADRADINQVVTAVAEAELPLKPVVTVRDKVLDAYKEIIRMPM